MSDFENNNNSPEFNRGNNVVVGENNIVVGEKVGEKVEEKIGENNVQYFLKIDDEQYIEIMYNPEVKTPVIISIPEIEKSFEITWEEFSVALCDPNKQEETQLKLLQSITQTLQEQTNRLYSTQQQPISSLSYKDVEDIKVEIKKITKEIIETVTEIANQIPSTNIDNRVKRKFVLAATLAGLGITAGAAIYFGIPEQIYQSFLDMIPVDYMNRTPITKSFTNTTLVKFADLIKPIQSEKVEQILNNIPSGTAIETYRKLEEITPPLTIQNIAKKFEILGIPQDQKLIETVIGGLIRLGKKIVKPAENKGTLFTAFLAMVPLITAAFLGI